MKNWLCGESSRLNELVAHRVVLPLGPVRKMMSLAVIRLRDPGYTSVGHHMRGVMIAGKRK